MGPLRLRSLICSLIHSTHIGIKRLKVQAHASGCLALVAAHWTFQFWTTCLGRERSKPWQVNGRACAWRSLRAAGQEAVSPLAGPPSSLNPATAHAVSGRGSGQLSARGYPVSHLLAQVRTQGAARKGREGDSGR